MKLRFSLAWFRSGKNISRAFKMLPAYRLFQDYTDRISRFIPCETSGLLLREKSVLWVCEREQKSRELSSVDVARELEKVTASGTGELQIVIGGADGFTARELEAMRPALRWSFGPMTLPHELAAVVAAEQVYRAVAIIRNHPYHRDH